MSVSKTAASMRRAAEEAVRSHAKACLACSRAAAGDGQLCPVGKNLASHAELMRKQEELLKSPLGPDFVQDQLW